MYKHEKYSEVPDRTLDTLDNWAKEGLPPGSFGMAVLTNDLEKAVGHADQENQEHLVEIVKYVYTELPLGCWGSKKAVRDWKEKIEASEDVKSSGV